ncbi:hypothetical protein ACTJKK_10765 [Microbacterium sp. 22179]|uniref:hypothetical protein n=1 Tax=Microbacterium sp. 22179 TaxID=3453886 RepID=UPI003F87A985
MSYDLEVYGKVALSTRDLVKVVSADRALKAQVDKRADALGAVVWKKSGAHFFTIDGPMQVEPEDLPEGWAEGEGATVLYSLSITYDVSEGPEGFSATVDGADADAAMAFAERLVARIDGAVWDPQTWEPTEVEVEVAPEAEPPQTLYLHMKWYRLLDDTKDLAAIYLRTAREFFPLAVPSRYGTHEPMQGRIPRDDDALFDRLYREECESSKLLLAGKVILHGSISHWTNELSVRVQSVRLTFEISRLEKAGAIDAIERFLVVLAERSEAFFASASVTRSRYVGGYLPFLPKGQWSGLSLEPHWMTWFGREYAELVRPHVDSTLVKDALHGLLHRWTDHPAPAAELRQLSDGPWIPTELAGIVDPDDDERCIRGASLMPESLRYPAAGSPQALRIEARYARMRENFDRAQKEQSRRR